jgi:hypothetical protein
MLETQYGERLSLRSLERYKQRHWQSQRELMQQASAALAASPRFAGEACVGGRPQAAPSGLLGMPRQLPLFDRSSFELW